MYQMNKDRGEREKRLEEELRIQRESLKSIAQAMEENRPRNTRPSSPETLFNSGDDDDHGSVAGNTVINNAESLWRTHDRLLKSLKRSGEYVNLDLFFKRLEETLQLCDIPQQHWKSYAVTHLSSYEDMRDLMLESTGYTPADAARSLFAAPSIEREQRTASGMWQKVESLLASLRSTAKSMEDLSNMISMGYVATHVGIECADYVDLRKPKSVREYARVLAEYDSRSKVLATSTSKQEQKFATKWCNYCRRKGHLEVDCFKKKKTEVSKTVGPKEKETPQQEE